jgi:phage-related protein
MVILANGFQKKTQKTPKKEIEKALKIKEEYENEKK